MNTIVFKNNTTYSESELVNLIKAANPSISDIKIKWLLFELEKSNHIMRIAKKRYVTNGVKYDFEISETSKGICTLIFNSYPNLDYVIWESIQLNEWLNFLLSKNIIFIEVESDLCGMIFSLLQEKYGNKQSVLLNPSFEVLTRYIDNNPIVVKPLFSRSPKGKNSHKISIEKMLVDVFSDKLLVSMIGTNDREEIARGIIKNYTVNRTKVIAYAKRRKCHEVIQHFLLDTYD